MPDDDDADNKEEAAREEKGSNAIPPDPESLKNDYNKENLTL